MILYYHHLENVYNIYNIIKIDFAVNTNNGIEIYSITNKNNLDISIPQKFDRDYKSCTWDYNEKYFYIANKNSRIYCYSLTNKDPIYFINMTKADEHYNDSVSILKLHSLPNDLVINYNYSENNVNFNKIDFYNINNKTIQEFDSTFYYEDSDVLPDCLFYYYNYIRERDLFICMCGYQAAVCVFQRNSNNNQWEYMELTEKCNYEFNSGFGDEVPEYPITVITSVDYNNPKLIRNCIVLRTSKLFVLDLFDNRNDENIIPVPECDVKNSYSISNNHLFAKTNQPPPFSAIPPLSKPQSSSSQLFSTKNISNPTINNTPDLTNATTVFKSIRLKTEPPVIPHQPESTTLKIKHPILFEETKNKSDPIKTIPILTPKLNLIGEIDPKIKPPDSLMLSNREKLQFIHNTFKGILKEMDDKFESNVDPCLLDNTEFIINHLIENSKISEKIEEIKDCDLIKQQVKSITKRIDDFENYVQKIEKAKYSGNSDKMCEDLLRTIPFDASDMIRECQTICYVYYYYYY